MKLMSIDDYRTLCFTGNSRPSRWSLRKLIKEGFIPGKKLGKTYYIDIDAEKLQTGNPLVDRVLREN